jgi:hypothetical protein
MSSKKHRKRLKELHHNKNIYNHAIGSAEHVIQRFKELGRIMSLAVKASNLKKTNHEYSSNQDRNTGAL